MSERCETKPMTAREQIGKCPGCRAYLWAEVDIVTTVSNPGVTSSGRAAVVATPRIVEMRLPAHHCKRNDQGEWEEA